MNGHKTAKQLRDIANKSDESIERAVTAVLQVAESAAEKGQYNAHVNEVLLGGADAGHVINRLNALGFSACTWSQNGGLNCTGVWGILVDWSDT